MNKHLLDDTVQEFIHNYKGDLSALAFSGSPFKNIPLKELLVQIESRSKIAAKLPLWYRTRGVLYPPKLNLEQSSSSQTAQLKATLFTGNTLADITGGFGIDAFYFAESFKEVTHFEINDTLQQLAKHNNTLLGNKNIVFKPNDGIAGIENTHYNVIYCDPSRRHEHKGKVFFLKDCQPNVPENLAYLLDRCDQLVIKTSPMLDISAGLTELSNVKKIYIIALENEVKEILWVLEKKPQSPIQVETYNITKTDNQVFKFHWPDTTVAALSKPLKYIYEPNAAIMKSGAFQAITHAYACYKLHNHSHLYTSENVIPFPGRAFKVNDIIPYSKKEIKKQLKVKKANVATRNFPETVSQIRKKWNIKDGGDIYLFFTTLSTEEKVVLVCKKIL